MALTNRKSAQIKPSETLAVKARANELKAKGKTIVDLSTGEPDIDTPEHIKEAANKALREGKTKYTPVQGIPELREAIAQKLTGENGIATEAKQVIVTNGGKQALYSLFDVTLEPGDEVVILAPYWVSYPVMVEMAGGKPVIISGDPKAGYRVSPAQLKVALTPRTRFVVLNSPSNPTGLGYSAAEQKALGEVIAPTGALVVSDEVYEKVTFGGFEFVSFEKACPALKGRVVTVNALSKTYSMTGWRVGYAAGPFEIIDAMIRHQSQSTSGINSISQYAAVAALKGPHDFIATMNQNFSRRIEMALQELLKAPGLALHCKPQGAFYLFIDFVGLRGATTNPAVANSTAFTNYLLDSSGVAAVPGSAFGDDGAFRISVAASDAAVEAGAKGIRTAVEQLLG
jgi:aspartate aminotransferase